MAHCFKHLTILPGMIQYQAYRNGTSRQFVYVPSTMKGFNFGKFAKNWKRNCFGRLYDFASGTFDERSDAYITKYFVHSLNEQGFLVNSFTVGADGNPTDIHNQYNPE